MYDVRVLASPPGTADTAGTCSDAELLIRAEAGGVEARQELAQRYRGVAYLLALQMLGNRDDALDVAQEAMLRFFTNLHRFAPGREVKPWLLAIVRNQVRDLWRRRRVRRTEWVDGAGEGLSAELIDAGPNPEETARRREQRRRVWRALSALSSDHREIVVLRDFHGLSYGEIADVLQIKAGTVMSRLHAARRRLRDTLSEEANDA